MRIVILCIIILPSLLLAQTPPGWVRPNSLDSSHVKAASIPIGKLSGLGNFIDTTMLDTIQNAHVAGFADSARVVGSTSANLTNATINGDITINGHISILNNATWFDTADVWCKNASSFLNMNPPRLTGGNDTTSALHPGVAYFPKGLAGYRIWAIMSMGTDNPESEQSFVRVSNDWITWVQPSSIADSILFRVDSLKSSDNEVAAYLSDPWIFAGSDGKVWFGTRASYTTGTKTALWVRSFDGTTLSASTRVLEVSATTGVIMSPYTFLDTSGNYLTWVVAGTDATETSRIQIYQHATPTSTWTLIDTVTEEGATGTYTNFPVGASTSTVADDSIWTGKYKVWHIGGADMGPDGKLIFITARLVTALGGSTDVTSSYTTGKPNYALWVGYTRDGRSLKYRWRPILRNTVTGFDSLFIYKAGGVIEESGGQKTVRLLYSAWGRASATGDPWRTALTSIRFCPRADEEMWSGGLWAKSAANAATDSLVMTFPSGSGSTSWLLKDSSYDVSSSLIDSFWLGGTVPYSFDTDSIILYYSMGQTGDAIDSLFYYIPKMSNSVVNTIVQADSVISSVDVSYNGTTAWTRVALAYNWELAAGQQWKMKVRQSFGSTGNRCLTIHDVKLKGRRLWYGDQWINR